MIPLTLRAHSDAQTPYVARLVGPANGSDAHALDATLVHSAHGQHAYANAHGTLVIDAADQALDGDIVFVDPQRGAVDRLIRASSRHNTLLVTERCDQLCVMCSQPPKKTHVDRFSYFAQACLAAPQNMVLGVSGGEPTLYKSQLLSMIEHVLDARPDLSFHILSNGQHFEQGDIERLRAPCFRNVTWGIPLYAPNAQAHDAIVAKRGAFSRLEASFAHLLRAGARVELRTVVMTNTVPELEALARHVTQRLSFIESWSIMQLENIGFAKNRWAHLYYDHASEAAFVPIANALVHAQLHGVGARLFNFPLCTVPSQFRHLAPASISDWKRKTPNACEPCQAKDQCSGFFEWHPGDNLDTKVKPL